MDNWIKRSALGLAGLLAAGQMAFAAEPEIVFAPTTTDISVGHAAHSSIPLGMGYWTEQGLKVKVVGIQGATAGLQQIAAKNVTFASVGPEVIINARAKGAKITAIYTYARATIQRAMALEGKGITKPEHVKGKTVGVVAMSTGSVPYGRQMLIAAGVDPDKDVKWLTIGKGGQAALALKNGIADVYLAWDTVIAPLQTQGMKFVQIKPAYHDALIGNAIITHDDFLKENPEIAVKLGRGIAKATLFGLTNPEAAIRMHWKRYPQTKPEGDEAKNMASSKIIFQSRFDGFVLPKGVKWGENLESQWNGIADLMKKEGLLPKDFDVKSVYTNALIDKINAFDQQAVVAQAKAAK